MLDGKNQIEEIKTVLKIQDRPTSPNEEAYIKKWLSMGFSKRLIEMAFLYTEFKTGGLNWAYMNKILSHWKEKGYMTEDAIVAERRRAEIERLQDENISLRIKIVDLQDALLAEKERVIQLLQGKEE